MKQPCIYSHDVSEPSPDPGCDSSLPDSEGTLAHWVSFEIWERHKMLPSFFPNPHRQKLLTTACLRVTRHQAESGELLKVCSCGSCFGCLMSVRSRRGFFICSFCCSIMSNCACCDCCTRLNERVYIHRNTDFFFFFFLFNVCTVLVCGWICVWVCVSPGLFVRDVSASHFVYWLRLLVFCSHSNWYQLKGIFSVISPHFNCKCTERVSD